MLAGLRRLIKDLCGIYRPSDLVGVGGVTEDLCGLQICGGGR